MKVMICPECKQEESNQYAKFCSYCGHVIETKIVETDPITRKVEDYEQWLNKNRYKKAYAGEPDFMYVRKVNKQHKYMHKMNLSELVINNEIKEADTSQSAIRIGLKENLITLEIKYLTGETDKFLFFITVNKEKYVEPFVSKLDEWDIQYKLPEDQTTKSIKKMGLAGAVGFAIAGPIGAVAGAYIANGRDIPIILKHKKVNLVLKGKIKDRFIAELQELDFYNKN